jgi:UDP-glucuronate decarboxylase
VARIFLTGATGFIGSHAARSLVEQGHEVHALVRDGADTERIADILPRIRVVPGSLTSLAEVRDGIIQLQPEICLHLAWYSVPGLYLTSTENILHLQGTLELLQIMAQAGCRRFVGAGTCLEYDTSKGTLSETGALAPDTLYSVCKLATCSIARDFAEKRKMEFAWLRFFYQYGPFEHPKRVVPAVITSLLSGGRAAVSRGTQVRDFLHVADVGSAVAAVATSSITGPVNIGSGIPVTIREIVEITAELCGGADRVDYGAIPQRQGDPAYIVADNSRLRSTGWKPRFDLRSGLRDSVEWWRNHSTMPR